MNKNMKNNPRCKVGYEFWECSVCHKRYPRRTEAGTDPIMLDKCDCKNPTPFFASFLDGTEVMVTWDEHPLYPRTAARVPCDERQGIPNSAVTVIVNRCKHCGGEVHRKVLTSQTVIYDDCTCKPRQSGSEELHAWIVDDGGTMAIWDERPHR
jgi:hypothetical protein